MTFNAMGWACFDWHKLFILADIFYKDTPNSLCIRLDLYLLGLVWFGFFLLWHINLCRLFNAKPILLEEQKWYYLTHSWEDKGVNTFPNVICLKVNIIAQLEFELVYYDSEVHCFNDYITRTPPLYLVIAENAVSYKYCVAKGNSDFDHLLRQLWIRSSQAKPKFLFAFVLYNGGRIFFILSFFVLYILPFGLVRLRTFRLSAWVSSVYT